MVAFQMVADPELQKSLCKYSSSTIDLKAREYLFHQGEEARGCYLIRRGVVLLYMEAPAGKRILGRELGPGGIVGLPATINAQPLSLTCRVLEDTELAFLSRQDLTDLMRNNPGAAMKILDLLSTEVQLTRKQAAKYIRRPRSASAPGT
jgi:CRP-like cAMP-binding protein